MLPDLSELSPAPIYTLEPGPFSVLVNELAKRLAPGSATIATRSAETLCAQVHQACRELATLGKLPGQSIDPKYDCYADPDGDVWKAAHVLMKGWVWIDSCELQVTSDKSQVTSYKSQLDDFSCSL